MVRRGTAGITARDRVRYWHYWAQDRWDYQRRAWLWQDADYTLGGVYQGS